MPRGRQRSSPAAARRAAYAGTGTVDPVGRTRLQQRIQVGAGIGASHGVGEQPVPPADAERTDRVLANVVVDRVDLQVLRRGGIPQTPECLDQLIKFRRQHYANDGLLPLLRSQRRFIDQEAFDLNNVDRLGR